MPADIPGKRAKIDPASGSTPLGYVFRLRPSQLSVSSAPVTPRTPRPTVPPKVLTGDPAIDRPTSRDSAKLTVDVPSTVSSSPSTSVKRKGIPTSPNDVGPEGVTADGEKRTVLRPVKRFCLSKRTRVKYLHPYAAATERRSAVFEMLREEMKDTEGGTTQASSSDTTDRLTVEERGRAEEKVEPKQRKKPRSRISAREKENMVASKKRINNEKQIAKEFGLTDDTITKQMQDMVLEYLNVRAAENVTPPPGPMPAPPSPPSKVAKWDKKDSQDIEEGYVIDVYLRDEAAAAPQPNATEEYGVIEFKDSDDEEWWYEGGDSDGGSSDVWGSDDEDSNAEDFHTNDYPDEPAYFSDEDGEYGGRMLADSDEDDFGAGTAALSWRPKRRTAPDDEEYDLDDDSSDDEVDRRKQMERLRGGVWGPGGKPKIAAVNHSDESEDDDSDSDEMEA